jgi:mono/diheme cytochrome c family protein
VAPLLSPIEPARVNGRVHVYKIGGSATLPRPAATRTPLGQPPTIAASAKDVERGAAVYGQFCLMCHGVGAGGGAIADLRRSARLHDAAQWRDVVGRGIPAVGMPSFAGDVTERDFELIRAYVARQAATLYAREQALKTP